jgi:hypothetical protein
MDAFGTDEGDFTTLLKGNWFLDHLLFHKLLSLDSCPVSAPCWVFSAGYRLMVFGALGSALQARQHMFSYVPLVHVLLKEFCFTSWCYNCAQEPHILSNDQAKMGFITSTCSHMEHSFPLSNLGAQVFPWSLHPPKLSSCIQPMNRPE